MTFEPVDEKGVSAAVDICGIESCECDDGIELFGLEHLSCTAHEHQVSDECSVFKGRHDMVEQSFFLRDSKLFSE